MGLFKVLPYPHGLALGPLAESIQSQRPKRHRNLVRHPLPTGTHGFLQSSETVETIENPPASNLAARIHSAQRYLRPRCLLEQHANALCLHSQPSDSRFPASPCSSKRKHHAHSKGVNGHGAGNRFCDHIIDNRSTYEPLSSDLLQKPFKHLRSNWVL